MPYGAKLCGYGRRVRDLRQEGELRVSWMPNKVHLAATRHGE